MIRSFSSSHCRLRVRTRHVDGGRVDAEVVEDSQGVPRVNAAVHEHDVRNLRGQSTVQAVDARHSGVQAVSVESGVAQTTTKQN